MVTVNDVLNTHLPTKLKEQIDAQFPTNPEALLDGVNYSYKEKTWNFRIAIVTDDTSKVKAVYVRINAPDDLYGCWFVNAGKKIHEGREIEWLTLRTQSDHTKGAASCSPTRMEKNAENIIIKPFLELLRNGQKDESFIAPKHHFFSQVEVENFFTKCPQLIPESDVPPPRNEHLDIAIRYFCLIASTCLLYKIASYAKNKWYSQPKPPVIPNPAPVV